MNKIIQFGETVPGYEIPVLNEREIRAAAGILFLATYTSLMFIAFDGNFIPVKFTITFFLLDLLIRVLINPTFSPLLIAGRFIVRKQHPEYVGAAQKKFAWTIGIVLSATMFVLFVIVNAYSPITALICLFCLLFLFFEAAFGICLGCVAYPWFYKRTVQHCPGEICQVADRQQIQQISRVQWLILILFIFGIVIAIACLTQLYSNAPHPMFKMNGHA